MQKTVSKSAIEDLPYRPCVGLVLLNRHRAIFAGQRLDSSMDAWQMPQGGIDPGETPREAALRELTEETGIDRSEVRVLRESRQWLPYELPRHLVPRLWGGRFRGQEQRWFALSFLGDDSAVNIEGAEPEFSRWTWMPHDELIGKIVPFKRDTYTAVFEEFRDLL